MNLSKKHGYISGRDISKRIAEGRPVISMDAQDVQNYEALRKVGVGFEPEYLKNAITAWGMDSELVFGGSITTPVQFLQTFLPGFVNAVFAPRKIDELIGMSTVGNWHDEEIIQGRLENAGVAVPYGDTTNVPLTSYNNGFERRTVVRFESGLKVGRLESARAGQQRLDAAAQKRISAQLALDIERNNVGFYGYNDGTNRTYGFLNDPSLPAYQTVATGASGKTEWAHKTFLEITADIRQAFSQLTQNSLGNVEAATSETTLAVPVGVDVYLSVTSDFGISVMDWLNKTYPKCRVVTAPQLNNANGGTSVFYLYAEKVNDGISSDNNLVWDQLVPTKFMALGIQNQVKDVLEDFTNATAGSMLKRPYAVYRGTGI